MSETVAVREINLRYLIDNFGLKRVRDLDFFPEWQEKFPELTDIEKQQLDRIQEGYFNLIEYPPLLENVVKLSIISPLLFIAGFFLPPFHIKAEKSISIQAEDDGVIIEGRIDILVLKDNFWATVIEAKQFAFSIEEGISQLLVYMLANPNSDTPTFGMISNGVSFAFIKLIKEDKIKYSVSDQFVITNKNKELYKVLQILKRLTN